MKAKCPNNPDHKRFVTVVYVSEDWVVDENGEFIEVSPNSEMCVLHNPNPDNIWLCCKCAAEAEVEK